MYLVTDEETSHVSSMRPQESVEPLDWSVIAHMACTACDELDIQSPLISRQVDLIDETGHLLEFVARFSTTTTILLMEKIFKKGIRKDNKTSMLVYWI